MHCSSKSECTCRNLAWEATLLLLFFQYLQDNFCGAWTLDVKNKLGIEYRIKGAFLHRRTRFNPFARDNNIGICAYVDQNVLISLMQYKNVYSTSSKDIARLQIFASLYFNRDNGSRISRTAHPIARYRRRNIVSQKPATILQDISPQKHENLLLRTAVVLGENSQQILALDARFKRRRYNDVSTLLEIKTAKHRTRVDERHRAGRLVNGMQTINPILFNLKKKKEIVYKDGYSFHFLHLHNEKAYGEIFSFVSFSLQTSPILLLQGYHRDSLVVVSHVKSVLQLNSY